MFTHKKVREIKRGNTVPSNAIYLRTETRQDLVAEGPTPSHDIYNEYLVDIYEIPCNEDGSTEIKVTYQESPAEYRRNHTDKCNDCWQTGGYHTQDCKYNPF